MSAETEARTEALSHLWSAIIHQGTPWTATGPAALVVAKLLSDERVNLGDESLRANLLEFLVDVAKAGEQSGCELEELERLGRHDIEHLIDAGDNDALYGDDEDAANAFYAR